MNPVGGQEGFTQKISSLYSHINLLTASTKVLKHDVELQITQRLRFLSAYRFWK